MLELLRGRGSLTAPLVQVLPGTLLMADISGFTALSEQLASQGKEGAERLTGIINRFFARVLDAAASLGGDTLTFAGDAVLVLFEGEKHVDRAAVAGLRMLAATAKMPAVDAAGRATKLGMSIGAHSGSFLAVGAGMPDERMHFAYLGPDAEEVARAEQAAQRGQLAVSASTALLLNSSWILSGDGAFQLVDAPADAPAPPPRRRVGHPDTGTAAVAQWEESADQMLLLPLLPPWVAQAVKSGRSAGAGAPEHRRASVVSPPVS